MHWSLLNSVVKLPLAILCDSFSIQREVLFEKRGYVQLRVANALWPQEGYAFLEDYLVLMEKYYGVLITPVDYGETEAARQKINAWMEEKTQDKIKELIMRDNRTGSILFLGRMVNPSTTSGAV